MKIVISLLLVVSSMAWAEGKSPAAKPVEIKPVSGKVQWIEKTVEVESNEKNATSAKRELIELALQKGTEELIKEIIGEAKYSRNHTLIQNKIIKNSNRYVPFTRPGELQAKDVGFKLSVNMKISQDDLQSLLLENGLFYDSDATPILLPIITIEDKMSSRIWGWWQDPDPKKSDLQKILRNMEVVLKNAFWKSNFYVIRPQSLHYQEIMPRIEDRTFLRFTSSASTASPDWAEIAGRWNAQIILQGEVAISINHQRSDSYVINVHLVAVQVQNSRSIGEVVRQFETEAGRPEIVIEQKLKEVLEPVSQDLASQVLEAWQKGTIGSNLFKLAIHGHVPMQMQENLKNAIKSKVHEIKNIKERAISMDEFVLEVDTNIAPKDLQQKMPRLSLDGYNIKFESANDKEAAYRWAKDQKE